MSSRLIILLFVLAVVITVGLILPVPKRDEMIGKTIPMPDAKGYNIEALNEAILKEKPYVLFVFFEITCKHCVESIPELNQLNREGDIKVVAFINEDDKKVQNYIRKHQIEYIVSKADKNFKKFFNVRGVPVSFLIDTRTMTVRERYLGKVSYGRIKKKIKRAVTIKEGWLMANEKEERCDMPPFFGTV
jgi:thiol-disulfide isomerase/thioredoxin